MAYWALLAKAGMQQGQQAAPGAKADPYGSFSHFMGATNANILDPFDIFGQSGNNPIQNFLNPGGATLIKGMTPSNNPLPIDLNPKPGVGAPGEPMGTGMTEPQIAGLMPAYANFLRNLGAPPMRGQGGPPPMSGSPGGGPGGGFGPNRPNFDAMAALSRFRQPMPVPGTQPR